MPFPPMQFPPMRKSPRDIRTPPFLPPGMQTMELPQDEGMDEGLDQQFPKGLGPIPNPSQRPGPQGPPPPDMMEGADQPFPQPRPMPGLPPGLEEVSNLSKPSALPPPPNDLPSELPEAPQLPGKLQAKPRPFNPMTDLPPLEPDKMGPIPPPMPEQEPAGLRDLRDSVDLYKHVRQGRPQMKPPGALNRIAAGAMGGLGAAMQLDRNPGMQAVGRQAMQGSGKFLRPGYDRDMANWNQEMELAEKNIGLGEKLNNAELASSKAKASGDYMKAQAELMRQKPELERNKGRVEITPQMVETFPDYWDVSEIGNLTSEKLLAKAMSEHSYDKKNASTERIAEGKNKTSTTIAEGNQAIAKAKIKSNEQIAADRNDVAKWIAIQRKSSGGRGSGGRDRIDRIPVINPETGENEIALINLQTGEKKFTGLKPAEKADWLKKLLEPQSSEKPGAAKATPAAKANSGNNEAGGIPKEGDQQVGSKGTIREYRNGNWVVIKAAPTKPK